VSALLSYLDRHPASEFEVRWLEGEILVIGSLLVWNACHLASSGQEEGSLSHCGRYRHNLPPGNEACCGRGYQLECRRWAAKDAI
jgi:hypothetical protein